MSFILLRGLGYWQSYDSPVNPPPRILQPDERLATRKTKSSPHSTSTNSVLQLCSSDCFDWGCTWGGGVDSINCSACSPGVPKPKRREGTRHTTSVLQSTESCYEKRYHLLPTTACCDCSNRASVPHQKCAGELCVLLPKAYGQVPVASGLITGNEKGCEKGISWLGFTTSCRYGGDYSKYQGQMW